jgi:hypothetical protein
MFLAACGRKGPLLPPEALVPAPIADLRAIQQGNHFLLSWSAPTKEEGGGPLRDLAGFRLFRRVVLPPGEDCEECPTAYRLLTAVDLEYLQDVRRAGNRYFYADADLRKGTTYQYKAVSLQRDGATSRASNKVRRTAVTSPLPPVVQAASTPSGVRLEFVAIPPDEGTLQGYNIYRQRPGEDAVLLATQPAKENTFEDQRLTLGVTYHYQVRAVALVNGETVESALSNEVIGALADPD